MNKYVLFLMALVFGAAFALDVEAQVEITYEKLPSQNSDSELHPGSFADGNIGETVAVSVADADSVPSEKVLRYGWVDLDFLMDSNKQLSEKRANIKNRDDELVRMRRTGEIEEAKWSKEIDAVRMEGLELLINAWNYCITSAVELGYIPLNISHREESIGDKLRNAPDITWQVGNLMRKTPLKPYMSDKIGKSDLKVAYIMYDVVIAKILQLNCYDLFKQVVLAGYSESDIANSEAKINSDFSDFLDQFDGYQLDIVKQVMDAIKSKSQAWGYDGIVLANSLFPPVILEAMDDVTYLAKQQCAPQELIQSFNEKVQKLCQEYRRRY